MFDRARMDVIQEVEYDTGKRVNTILQLQYQAQVIRFKSAMKNITDAIVDVRYHSPRGRWYRQSWKGSTVASGGLITNIGIHILHLMIGTLGEPTNYLIYTNLETEFVATIYFPKAVLELDLNIHRRVRPQRLITVEPIGVSFDLGYDLPLNLHTRAYEAILAGEGFDTADVRHSIRWAEKLRNVT